jgi:hypothetical protein
MGPLPAPPPLPQRAHCSRAAGLERERERRQLAAAPPRVGGPPCGGAGGGVRATRMRRGGRLGRGVTATRGDACRLPARPLPDCGRARRAGQQRRLRLVEMLRPGHIGTWRTREVRKGWGRGDNRRRLGGGCTADRADSEQQWPILMTSHGTKSSYSNAVPAVEPCSTTRPIGCIAESRAITPKNTIRWRI